MPTATPAPHAITLSAEEYDAQPPNSRIELVDGVVRVLTPATGWHQDVVDELKVAVEVVGPGTETVDRKHKPAEYASAGIQHYWRVETTPDLVLHTFQLGETGIYLETGIFRSGDTTAVPGLPWAKIVIDDLVP